jgi:putative chitinase
VKPGPNLFAAIRKRTGGHLTQEQVNNLTLLGNAVAGLPLRERAYILATVLHETGPRHFVPISELGGLAYFTRMYDVTGSRPDKAMALGNDKPGDGVKYHGRGFVQITGKANYVRASRELGQDFVTKPELALNPKYAAAILVRGMTQGWFGPPLRESIAKGYANARRSVNGADKADLIAGYATAIEAAIRADESDGHATAPPQRPTAAPRPIPAPQTPAKPQRASGGLVAAAIAILAALGWAFLKGH